MTSVRIALRQAEDDQRSDERDEQQADESEAVHHATACPAITRDRSVVTVGAHWNLTASRTATTATEPPSIDSA